MKKLFTIFALALIAFMAVPKLSKASHMAGAEITFLYAGTPSSPNDWLIRVKFFRDCSGISAPNPIPICVQSASLGNSFSVNIPEVSVTPIGSSPCVNAPQNNCPGGIGDFEEHIYEQVVTLPAPATDWIFAYGDCCRNTAITTIAPNGLYVESLLNSVAAPTDNSPQFNSLAYTRFCVGNAFYYDQGATDPDGDSLNFSLVPAQDGSSFSCPSTGTDYTYINPYSATSPAASSVPITIDPHTGIIYFIPSLQQVAVLVVKVDEYRNGVHIGYVKRDIQINILGQCNTIVPAFPSGILTSSGGNGAIQATCDQYSIILPFDTSFQCSSAIPSDFRMVMPNGQPNPVVAVSPINCSSGKTDSLLITFLNPFITGTSLLWVKIGNDGNTLLSECGTQLPPGRDTVRIYVPDNSIWTPYTQDSVGCTFNSFSVDLNDSIYCWTIANDGSDFILKDANNTILPIQAAYGYCVPNGFKTKRLLINMVGNVSAVGPVYLLLTNNGGTDGNTIGNNCGRFLLSTDTIAILNINNKINVNLGSDQTICNNMTMPVLNSGYTGLQYQWFNNGIAIPGATFDTLNVTASGNYTVQVNSSPTCLGRDTVSITILPAPTDNLGQDITQCINDPFPTFNAGNAGATYQWQLNGNNIAGATSQTYTPTVGGHYNVLVNAGGVCPGNYDIQFTTVSAYNVTLSNQTICSTGTYPTLDAGNTGATYQWTLNSNAIAGATSQTYTPTVGGVYGVTVGSGSCAGTANMTLTVANPATDNLGNDITQCINDPKPTFDAGNSGAAYQWYTGAIGSGTIISGATSETYQPTTGGSYYVQITTGGVCVTSYDINYTTVNAYSVTTLSNQTICANGTYPLLDAGNTGAATYQWTLNNNPISGATSQTYQPTAGGTYGVTVGTGTCAGTGSMNLTVVALPVVSLTDASICDYDVIPTLDAGNAGATYLWSSGATSETYTPIAAGTYSVTVTVNPSCSTTGSMTLTIKPSPVVAIADTTICNDGQASLDAQVSGANYNWSTGATTQVITTNKAGTYTVVVTQNGCSKSDTVNVAVNTYPVAPVVACNAASTSTLKYVYTWNAIPGAASYEVSEDGGVTWIPNNPVSGNESHGTNSPKFLVRAIGSGLCKTGATSEPIACDLIVYNAFSPNNDGKNDFFLITNIEQYPRNTVQVFNRWGNEVYNESGYDNSSKKFDGKNLPDGVYFYIINKGDGTKNLTGTVNISH